MRFSSTLVLVAVLLTVNAGCSTVPGRESSPEESQPGHPASEACRPSLSTPEILATALEALEMPSERVLRRDYEVSIETQGCNYVLLAQRRNPVAVEPIRLVIDRTARIVNPPTCWWLGDLGNCPFPFEGHSLELGPLIPSCTIRKSWAGLRDLPDAAWLVCKGWQPALLTHPLNLLGKVQIQSRSQALQFVRLFSSSATYQLFFLGGMLEVGARATLAHRELIQALRDQGKFHEPRLQSGTENGSCVDRNVRRITCMRTTYTIRRLAAFYDGCVYELTEKVGEDGAYELVKKNLILEDIGRFGLHHEPQPVAPPDPSDVPQAPPVTPPL